MVSRSIAARPTIDVRLNGTGRGGCGIGARVHRIVGHADARASPSIRNTRAKGASHSVGGALGDGIEHGLHVGRRARDHAQDLADRRLLLQRILQLAACARRPCARGPHTTRAIAPIMRLNWSASAFQFVAGVDVDPLVEIALADAPRAFVERADRPHHAARERQRAQRGNHESGQQQQPGAQDRRVQLRVDLRHRLLDEHVPAERLDRRHRRQHRACRRDRCESIAAVIGALSADGRLHMRQAATGRSCAAPGRCPDRRPGSRCGRRRTPCPFRRS